MRFFLTFLGNLEKAREQSKESCYRRKQRKTEAGETVRSYKAPKRNKKTYRVRR